MCARVYAMEIPIASSRIMTVRENVGAAFVDAFSIIFLIDEDALKESLRFEACMPTLSKEAFG